MINYLLRLKLDRIARDPPQRAVIDDSSKVLFSLFTRYGDTIISLVVIKEFIDRYPDKEYLILCPRQMKPYVYELLPNQKCISLNKRNLIDMFKVIRVLKRERIDVGFNPWSSGVDSCYFLTYCNYALCYSEYARTQEINHYQVVREYLMLPEKKWKIGQASLEGGYNKILICPESTDEQRSMPIFYLDKLINDLRGQYIDANITIASMSKSFFRDDCCNVQLEKSEHSSRMFIDLVKKSGLSVCVDSGPLHIASVIGGDLIAVFNSTKPELVINSGVNTLVYRGMW